MTVCEMLGLHSLVPARQFSDYPKTAPGLGAKAYVEPARTDYRDGLACVRCPHFEAQPLTRSQASRISTHSPT